MMLRPARKRQSGLSADAERDAWQTDAVYMELASVEFALFRNPSGRFNRECPLGEVFDIEPVFRFP